MDDLDTNASEQNGTEQHAGGSTGSGALAGISKKYVNEQEDQRRARLIAALLGGYADETRRSNLENGRLIGFVRNESFVAVVRIRQFVGGGADPTSKETTDKDTEEDARDEQVWEIEVCAPELREAYDESDADLMDRLVRAASPLGLQKSFVAGPIEHPIYTITDGPDPETFGPRSKEIDLKRVRDQVYQLREDGEVFHKSMRDAATPVLHEWVFGTRSVGSPAVKVHLKTANVGIQGAIKGVAIFTRAGGEGIEETLREEFEGRTVTAGQYRDAYGDVFQEVFRSERPTTFFD
jgi:hypothetical protein